MKEFVRSLLAELAPAWFTQRQARREDEPPVPVPGRDADPGDRPGKEPAPEPEPVPPIDPGEQERPITPVPPVR